MAALLLRGLGFLFFWVFLGWWRQAPGLIGPQGILPARGYLHAVAAAFPPLARLAFAPSLLWLSSSTFTLHLLCAVGMAAAIALLLRWHPRWALGVCLLAFLSLIACAQAFASYQSDGMLMAAGLGGLLLDNRAAGPNAWSWFYLRWVWFSIYFGSGIAKWTSGDPQWRHLTALDQYYQNLPLPNWLSWYAQQYLPHTLQAAIAAAILVLETGVVWLGFLPRRWRIACFWIVTPFQIAIILTANYGFLNYLVLLLGLTLLDDRHLHWLLCRPEAALQRPRRAGWGTSAAALGLMVLVLLTAWNLGTRVWPRLPPPTALNRALQPFRIADPYGLFAVMTRNRYEIEFQGTRDGRTWTPYPFRFKPQDLNAAPVGDSFLFAPYQPRFDWNLWFASLGSYRQYRWVEATELRLLDNDAAVLSLFAANPFAASPPRAVRAVIWQYWFTTPAQRKLTGAWWRRRLLGLYAPALVATPSGARVLTLPN